MVNWNRRLVYPGGDNSFMEFIHALGHCFGVLGPTEDSRSQGCGEQTSLGQEVETQVYSHAGYDQDLP